MQLHLLSQALLVREKLPFIWSQACASIIGLCRGVRSPHATSALPVNLLATRSAWPLAAVLVGAAGLAPSNDVRRRGAA